MSIASRIESIENHLSNDYVEIARLGADLTNVDQNIENIAEAIREAYSKMPKVLGTGSNLSLSPTLKGGLDITPIGACEQDSYSGKNVLELPNTSVGTTIVGTNVDDVITLSGTATSSGALDFTLSQDLVLNGDYNVLVEFEGIRTNVTTFQILFRNNSDTNIFVNNLASVNKVNEIKTSLNDTLHYVRLYFNTTESSYTLNGTLKLMLTKSSTLDDTFEKYVGGTASPNPSYPQDVRVVTGDNEVVVTPKNLCNARQDSFSFNANDNANMRIININENLNKIHLLKDVKYYISYTVENNSTTNLRNTPNLKIGQNTNYYQSTASNFNTTSGRKVWEFTAPETGDYEVKYWVNSSDVAITISDFMISTSSDTTYSPYQAPQSVTLHNVPDLAGIGTYKDEIVGKTDDWNIVRKVGKVVFKDNTFEYFDSLTNVVKSRLYLTELSIEITNGLCNGFTYIPSYSNDSEHFYFYGNVLYVFINKSRLSEISSTGVNNYFANNNFYGYYIKATPTEEPITDTTLISDLNNMYNLMGYDGQTNISITSNSSNAQMVAQVSALKGE